MSCNAISLYHVYATFAMSNVCYVQRVSIYQNPNNIEATKTQEKNTIDIDENIFIHTQ